MGPRICSHINVINEVTLHMKNYNVKDGMSPEELEDMLYKHEWEGLMMHRFATTVEAINKKESSW